MMETWIVAVDESYYPAIYTFATEAEARAVFDVAFADLSERALSHTAIYIGRIDQATHTRQKNLGWQPVTDDPDRDGYCNFCRDRHLPEGEWTPT